MLEQVVSRGHEYTIHPWPLWLSAGAIALGALSLVGYSLPQAGGRRAPQMGCAPLFLVILVGALFVGMPVLAWWSVGGPYGGSSEIHSYRVFRPFLERATWSSVLGASLFLFGLVVQRSRKVQGRPAALAFGLGAAGLLCGAAVMAHATWFVVLDCLPRFEREGHQYLHVGRPREVRTLVSCGAGFPVPDVQTVTATQAGPLSYSLEIASSTIRVRHSMSLTAGEELGSPRFNVREGNRWRYERVSTSRSAAAFGASTSSEDREEVLVSIGEAHVEHGLRLFPLTIEYPDERPVREELLAWNGALYTWRDSMGGQMTEFLPAEPVEEPYGGFFLPGRCSGLPEAGPAAPLECRERANPIAATGAAVLRVLTVGAATYLPPRPVHFLREARFGPEGGPEVSAGPLLSPTQSPDEEEDESEARRPAPARTGEAERVPDREP
ncbi:MAG: hypothetical protein R3B40_19070 [Polyangiales bacterium]|nr:hypothetical protein [Sandaracinaceae bacterium]